MAAPLWTYIPGCNRGAALTSRKEGKREYHSHAACRALVRVSEGCCAIPNANYAPELNLTKEELADILENELPEAVGWVPPVERMEVVAQQLRPRSAAHEVRTIKARIRTPGKERPWR